MRAAIAFARGDDRTFEADIERVLVLAEKATDAQAKAPDFVSVAYLRLGLVIGARRRSCSTRRSRSPAPPKIGMELITVRGERSWLALLELDPRRARRTAPSETETPRQRATAALLEGDLLRTPRTRSPSSGR